MTSSLVENVIVYLCFLTFSSFSLSVRDLFQHRFLVCCVVTHLCWEMGLFTGANDVPVVKVFALHSSTSWARYTKNSKQLFRTNSWLTLCFILSKKGITKFSSLPIPARFSPKSKCTVDTTIYQTQVRIKNKKSKDYCKADLKQLILFFITIFRLAIPAFFRFTDVTELM